MSRAVKSCAGSVFLSEFRRGEPYPVPYANIHSERLKPRRNGVLMSFRGGFSRLGRA
ncbi:Hypothetical protein FKW44_015974, partial [Caligus rogercresseyi]